MTDGFVWGGSAWMGVLVQDVSFGARAAGVSFFFLSFYPEWVFVARFVNVVAIAMRSEAPWDTTSSCS